MPTAAFLGVLDLPLRTFTTTYPHIAAGGWSFAANALMPMEFGCNLSSGNVLGFACNIFDFQTGSTRFNYGNVSAISGAANANGCIFQRTAGNNGRISAWLQSANALMPYQFGDNVTLGTPKTAGFNVQSALVLPNVANTTAPEPFIGWNYETASKLNAGTSRVNLSPFYNPMVPASLAVGAAQPVTFTISTAREAQFSIPYNGLNYIFMRDSTGGTPTAVVYISADFFSSASSFVPTLTNPPGSSIDLNAYINAVATTNPQATYQGFLWMNKSALTITGKSFNGFGILMLPNGTGYYLLNFVPVDAGAANWNTGISDVAGKFDDQGTLWLQTSSAPGTVWSTTPIAKNTLPVYPPIGLPEPPNDSQLTVRAYRGQSQ